MTARLLGIAGVCAVVIIVLVAVTGRSVDVRNVASPPTPITSPTSVPTRSPGVPATSVDGLSGDSLPKADSLGDGWSSRVDPGSAEDGYSGNGTANVARDPADVAAAMIPFGCSEMPENTRLPVASAALDVSYNYKPTNTSGVGLVLKFETSQAARQLFDQYRDVLKKCSGGAQQLSDKSATTVWFVAESDNAFATIRRDPSLPKREQSWTEAAAINNRQVRLITVNADAPIGELTPTQMIQLIAK